MSAAKRLSAKFHLAVTVVAVFVYWCTEWQTARAEHEHGACPDYSEYHDVLNGGLKDLERGPASQNVSPTIRDFRGVKDQAGAIINRFQAVKNRQAMDRYAAHKEPTLQCTIDTAANEEVNDDLVSARRWWSSIAEELKARPEYKRLYARSLSRLADVEILLSRADLELLDDKIPVARRALMTHRSEKPSKNERISLELSLPDMDRGSAYKLKQAIEQLSEKRKSTPLVAESDSTAFLKSAMQHYRDALAVEQPSENFIGYALDLLKVASIEERLGDRSNVQERLKEATELLAKNRDTDDWLSKNDFNLEQMPIAFVTQKIIRFASEHLRDQLPAIEIGLEHYFSTLWVSPAMDIYASLGKRDDVVRLYKDNESELLSTNDISSETTSGRSLRMAATDIFAVRDQTISRVMVAEALIKVGEARLAQRFCEQWVNSMPIDKIGAAFNAVAVAEVQRTIGEKQEFYASMKKAVEFINQARAESEPAARAKLLLCSRIEADLKEQTDKKLQVAVAELKQQASHRIMQLECIALAKRLSETGRRLERLGNYDAAGRMYLASSDIKSKNLGEADLETTEQQIDAGRVLLLAGQYKAAADQLRRAVTGVRKMKEPDQDLLRSTMESYADALSKSAQEAEAQKVYDELRTLGDGTPKVIIEEDLGYLYLPKRSPRKATD
jgi:hypothetical protein